MGRDFPAIFLRFFGTSAIMVVKAACLSLDSSPLDCISAVQAASQLNESGVSPVGWSMREKTYYMYTALLQEDSEARISKQLLALRKLHMTRLLTPISHCKEGALSEALGLCY